MTLPSFWGNRRIGFYVWRFNRNTPIDVGDKTPTIVKKWETSLGTLLLLGREKNKVNHGAYQFTPHYLPGTKLLLTVDRYWALKQGSVTPTLQGMRGGKLCKGHEHPTHRITLSILESSSYFTTINSYLYWSYPVDFVGINGLFKRFDHYAIRITATLANELLKHDYRSIDWEARIELAAREQVGANHDILLE